MGADMYLESKKFFGSGNSYEAHREKGVRGVRGGLLQGSFLRRGNYLSGSRRGGRLCTDKVGVREKLARHIELL